jgi:hypothetical protein
MKEPAFWEDIIQDLPVCIAFRENWSQILSELKVYLSGNGSEFFITYPKIKVDNPDGGEEMTQLYEGAGWKIATAGVKTDPSLRAWGGPFIEDYVKNKFGINLQEAIASVPSLLPTVHSIAESLESQGHLFNAFVSVLSPDTKILPHRGDANLMRIHLGLICDPDCRITVGDEVKTWAEGELLAFKDGGPYPHSVEHNGTRDRWVLVFDLTLDYLRSVIDHPML